MPSDVEEVYPNRKRAKPWIGMMAQHLPQMTAVIISHRRKILRMLEELCDIVGDETERLTAQNFPEEQIDAAMQETPAEVSQMPSPGLRPAPCSTIIRATPRNWLDFIRHLPVLRTHAGSNCLRISTIMLSPQMRNAARFRSRAVHTNVRAEDFPRTVQNDNVASAAARRKHIGERTGGGIALRPQRSVSAHQTRSQASRSRPRTARNENVLRRSKRKAPAVVVGDPAGASDARAQDDEHS